MADDHNHAQKRKDAPSQGDDRDSKKRKTPYNKKRAPKHPQATIEPGDAGVWVTCNRNQEAKCVRELKFLFEEYAQKLYGIAADGADDDAAVEEGDEGTGIEELLKGELAEMKVKKKDPLFTNVRMDFIFIKTRPPIDPIALVETICKDAKETGKQRTKWVLRLTPMTCMAKATPDGLHDAAEKALAPVFHQGISRTFAVRPTVRNHSTLKRPGIIRQLAAEVGDGHKVDLKDPDFTILVDIYTNLCGVSVVGRDYEQLKRFNLAEIYQPTVNRLAESSGAKAPKDAEEGSTIKENLEVKEALAESAQNGTD